MFSYCLPRVGGDLLLALILFIAVSAFASPCRINSVQWQTDHESYEESQVQALVGKPCESWPLTRNRVLSYYENHGFLAAKIVGEIDSSGALKVSLELGSAWVWGAPENLDSSKTKLDVFRKLTGIEAGKYVSPLDLERSDLKLARLGYFYRMSPAQMLRTGRIYPEMRP